MSEGNERDLRYKRFLTEEEKRRYELEKKYSKRNYEENSYIDKVAPTTVFDGINQDEFTKRSHEAILSNLRNEGVEDIDELETPAVKKVEDEEEEDELTPYRYY